MTRQEFVEKWMGGDEMAADLDTVVSEEVGDAMRESSEMADLFTPEETP